jgi:hypothetical protein
VSPGAVGPISAPLSNTTQRPRSPGHSELSIHKCRSWPGQSGLCHRAAGDYYFRSLVRTESFKLLQKLLTGWRRTLFPAHLVSHTAMALQHMALTALTHSVLFTPYGTLHCDRTLFSLGRGLQYVNGAGSPGCQLLQDDSSSA